MKLVCSPVKEWPRLLPVDFYEFTRGKEKFLYDRERKLAFVDVDWKEKANEFESLIISYHNFDETPDLEEVLAEMKRRHSKARYYKIAAFANSTLDALRMVHFQRKHKDVIGLSMGEKGVITRILTPFTYAPLREEDKTAPGQLLWSELDVIYNYRAVTPQTRIYGLIGNPVSQSIGHLYHNDRFRALNMDAVYVKLVVSQEELPEFFKMIEGLNFWGFSVTAPLKEKITGWAHPVNTLFRTSSGWHACNTDGVALAEVLGDVAGRKVVILGAGGAAKAIETVLLKQRAHVTVLRRNMSIPEYDILINATSSSNPDFADRFIPGEVVMDIGIKTSPFILRAQASGCETMDGLAMYFAQAVRQSELWLTAFAQSHKPS